MFRIREFIRIALSAIIAANNMLTRQRILFKGIVQGVGFRPFLYRSAKKFNLCGFVKNTSGGVILEIEGPGKTIKEFMEYIIKYPPPLSLIENYQSQELKPQNCSKFEIVPSESYGESDILVSPDIAVCHNCRAELFRREDRRYEYPFINCTDCGPRFSIIEDLPYDRPKTTMSDFRMCGACQTEYLDPEDRRYHAQPVSCFQCGPALSFISSMSGEKIPGDGLEMTAEKLKENSIAAVKGLGGYHLACKALSTGAVARMRELKGRETKPFALMATLEMIRQHAFVSAKEEELLCSPASPILLLKRKKTSTIASPVAPGLDELGFMLPYTPIHLLLLEKVQEPLVMTSANISDEPIIYRDEINELRRLCDYILTNDRKIHNFADDSVLRVFENEPYLVRRSRGFVPLPIKLPIESPKTILALGPMLKTTFTFLFSGKAIMSQYIGDTDSPAAIEAEKTAIAHFMKLFSLQPDLLVVDKHPGYPNREIAAEFNDVPVVEIQHHKAHVGALLAETGERDKIIGVSLDGTGYGDDGKIWGGEFFTGDYRDIERFGHFKYLFLPSGDLGAKEPWRFALSVLYSLYGSESKTKEFAGNFGKKGEALLEAIEKQAGGILTSSCGRVFDAAAALLGIGNFNSYEGEMPIKLQAAAAGSRKLTESYNFTIAKEGSYHIFDLLPAFRDMIEDKRSAAERALIFHNTLAVGVVKMAEIARDKHHIDKVGLTGGVYQNVLLLSLTKKLLQEKEFRVLLHRKVPTNDGGVSLGQAFLAAARVGAEPFTYT